MIDPNAPGYRPRDHRLLGIGLCLGAVVLFVYASFSHRWLENVNFGDSRIGFSLIAFEACASTKCQTTSTFALIKELKQRTSRREEPPSGVFAPAGVTTMALSLLSVLALGFTAFLGWKKKRLGLKVLPHSIALLSIMGALIAGCLFIAKKPGGYAAVGVGPSFWAFAIACVIGIAGAQVLSKYIRPIDPDLGPSASGNAL
ncbi:MAG: hypothetical protein M4D80_18660 [Myxococcota bacterium]|nr:hypothetical protein [Deltaproteobacteria bacterium]MDQ3337189.1 hypothetical protein [Myxococcota bacterium]